MDIGAFERPNVTGLPTVYTVDLTSASGAGSGNAGDLVFAVNQANANTNPAGSVIAFDPAVFNAASPQMIVLGSPLGISGTTAPIAIDGPGAALTVFGGFTVGPNVTASLAGLTVSSGSTTSGVGHIDGIDNSGYLTVTASAIADNVWGAVSNRGHLTVVDSAVTNNGSYDFNDPVISSNGGVMTLVNTTIADNTNEVDSTINILSSAGLHELHDRRQCRRGDLG